MKAASTMPSNIDNRHGQDRWKLREDGEGAQIPAVTPSASVKLSAEEIRDRMSRIRSQSIQQKAMFVDNTARMLDWKEHVRAVPVTALVASTLVGFSLLYRRKPMQSAPAKSFDGVAAQMDVRPKTKSSMSPIASAALSIASSFLLSTGKQFLMSNLQSILSNKQNEHQPSKSPVTNEIH